MLPPHDINTRLGVQMLGSMQRGLGSRISQCLPKLLELSKIRTKDRKVRLAIYILHLKSWCYAHVTGRVRVHDPLNGPPM